MKKDRKQQIIIYKDKTGPKLEVSLQNDTVWLTQSQICELFNRDQSVVSRHIHNIFREGEIDEKSNMQFMHIANSDKPVAFYSLDMVISVGYRISSKRATQFRIWATKVIKRYLLQGFVLNEKTLKNRRVEQLKELENAIVLLQQTVARRELTSGESKALLGLISDYTHSWILLQKYDKAQLTFEGLKKKRSIRLSYEEAQLMINTLKQQLIKNKEASELFGSERDHTLQALLGNMYQTFGGVDLYQSVEEKAAHLLYFVIKDHPFSDGNKRIASFLFIVFLMRNKLLFNKKGERKINDAALVAVALLVAESDPKQKDLLIKLIVNFIK